MNANLEHFPDCWINQRAHKTRCGCVVYSHCSGRLDRCFTVILLLGGQVALPPIAVTDVALSGISRYYNISGSSSSRILLNVTFGNGNVSDIDEMNDVQMMT